MATSLSNKNRMYLTTAGVLAVGIAAYGLGRVFPPLGPSAGHRRAGAALRLRPGRRRRRHARRHLGSRADADRRLPGDGQGPELPRARGRPGLRRSGVEPGGDGGDRGQSGPVRGACEESVGVPRHAPAGLGAFGGVAGQRRAGRRAQRDGAELAGFAKLASDPERSPRWPAMPAASRRWRTIRPHSRRWRRTPRSSRNIRAISRRSRTPR